MVEEFGILDALFPGRIDLGLGRSGSVRGRPPPRRAGEPQERVVDGVLIPKPFSFAGLLGSPRFRAQIELLRQPEAQTPAYDRDRRRRPRPDRRPVPLVGGCRGARRTGRGRRRASCGCSAAAAARAPPWPGSAGCRSRRTTTSARATVLDAVEAYRAAFRPSAELAAPVRVVSADVVVGRTTPTAHQLAAATGPGCTASAPAPGPSRSRRPGRCRGAPWTAEDRELVDDRLRHAVRRLARDGRRPLAALRAVTGADELLVTTITHRHEDRVPRRRSSRRSGRSGSGHRRGEQVEHWFPGSPSTRTTRGPPPPRADCAAAHVPTRAAPRTPRGCEHGRGSAPAARDNRERSVGVPLRRRSPCDRRAARFRSRRSRSARWPGCPR